VARG
jgi:hypothetical protein